MTKAPQTPASAKPDERTGCEARLAQARNVAAGAEAVPAGGAAAPAGGPEAAPAGGPEAAPAGGSKAASAIDSGKAPAADAPRILLHACCGPCTLEPSRLLAEQGYVPTVYYTNSNIEPADEYEHRLRTLLTWANTVGLPVIEGPYDNTAWRFAVADRTWEDRAERCRACYRHRFEETARYAADHGFAIIGTTLSVSPYQHTGIIAEELQRAARAAGVQALFEDYRPQYPQATQRSRDLGMYRQNFCGCALSCAEAARERAERKAARTADRLAREQERAAERKEQDEMRAAARAEKTRYAEERARRHQILKQLRSEGRNDGAPISNPSSESES